MTKITKQLIDAWINKKKIIKGNTEINISTDGHIYMNVWGNNIARICNGILEVNHCGYKTNLTKNRLNSIPGVTICQKKGVWYLNGKEMLNGWNKVL